ncbi:MAG: alpha/beta fold hydrolase, partial [Sphingomonadales bacterium]
MMQMFPVAGEIALAGEFAGPADAPIILFLHGGGQTRHAWRATAHMIARHGFRALCIDQRGHGDSDRDPSGAYDMDMFAADVRALLATVPNIISIIGASLGGMASLLALGDRDEQTACPSLVLVDIAHR